MTISNLNFTSVTNTSNSTTTLNLTLSGQVYLYPVSSHLSTDLDPLPNITGSNEFVTFGYLPLIQKYESASIAFTVEAPCTLSTPSNFNYNISPAIPSWLTFTQDPLTSTQVLTSTPVINFLTADFVQYNATLCNNEPYSTQTKCWSFLSLIFKCPDPQCTACDSFNETAGWGICTACGSGFQVVDQRCALCGNGIIETGEGCDDSNTVDGDGCYSNCQLEPNWECTGAPSTCTYFYVCGNGFLQFSTDPLLNEVCDDQNLNPGDGCTDNCTVEIGFTCTNV